MGFYLDLKWILRGNKSHHRIVEQSWQGPCSVDLDLSRGWPLPRLGGQISNGTNTDGFGMPSKCASAAKQRLKGTRCIGERILIGIRSSLEDTFLSETCSTFPFQFGSLLGARSMKPLSWCGDPTTVEVLDGDVDESASIR